MGEEEDEEQPRRAAAAPCVSDDQAHYELEENTSEQEQPTLCQILKAVNKCTASVDMLKTRLGCLSEDRVNGIYTAL